MNSFCWEKVQKDIFIVRRLLNMHVILGLMQTL